MSKNIATNRDLKEMFDIFDSRYFKFSKSMRERLVDVRFGEIDGLGRTFRFRTLHGRKCVKDRIAIRINPKCKWSRRVWAMTLLHEMVHFKLVDTDKGRGDCGSRMFQREMKRLALRGAMNWLW